MGREFLAVTGEGSRTANIPLSIGVETAIDAQAAALALTEAPLV